jgi:hypothetical protein
LNQIAATLKSQESGFQELGINTTAGFLVLVQPDFGLGLLEQALDGPAHARHPRQLGERGILGRVGEKELDLLGISNAAPD